MVANNQPSTSIMGPGAMPLISTRAAEELDGQRRQLVAERLAATSIFCNVRSYASKTSTNEQDSSMAVSSLPTQEEPDLAGSPLTPGHFREVLGTGLFAPAGPGTVTFVHQSLLPRD